MKLLNWVVWASILSLAGCKGHQVLPNTSVMPPELVFVLLDSQGNSLLTSTASPIQVYTITASGQKVVLGAECAGGGCTMVRAGEPPYNYFFQSLYASTGSAEANQKTWYIELNGKTDTLYYDVRKKNTQDQFVKYELYPCFFNGDRLPDQYPFILRQKR